MRPLILFALTALLVPAASAEYDPPGDAARHLLIAMDWSYQPGQSPPPGPQVRELTRIDRLLLADGNRMARIQIDWFRMADRVDGNTICAGDYETPMREYLAELDARRPRPVVLVELADPARRPDAADSGGRVRAEPTPIRVVAGIWVWGADACFARARAAGIPQLDVEAAQVVSMGRAWYDRRIAKASGAAWQLLAPENVPPCCAAGPQAAPTAAAPAAPAPQAATGPSTVRIVAASLALLAGLLLVARGLLRRSVAAP